MSRVVLFDGVSKRYLLDREPSRDLREALAGLFRRRERRREEFLALRDVSFHVDEGETLGIVGANGAGKSTVLKILAGIAQATRGDVHVRGRVTPLLEVGAGFHPDLTGRENVYLNASILGLRRREIRQRFDSIVDFAELAAFIDVPVKRYSSGMQMRLGFAIATHADPEVFLIDEVLAVGDLAFQRKCLDAINELRRRGKVIVFVSHSLHAIAAFCDRALFLKHGSVVAHGAPDDILAEYRRDVMDTGTVPDGLAEADERPGMRNGGPRGPVSPDVSPSRP